MPDEKLAPATEWEGLYRVSTTTDEFTTRHFSVIDSTLVITKLSGSDKQYGQIKLPLTIALADVRSVERLENNNSHTALLVAGVLLVAGTIAAIVVVGSAIGNVD
ncbi:MAG TPA: hypothetical protein VFH33_06340 [Candidatus Krumholzibacteria bacterium]|nr:hypothetical protein [Candidatus Krumholzibacteria bacterium]